MISISKPLTPGKVASYYREEYTSASQSYYAQRGHLLGEWHGKLAAEFGLSGAVDELMFNRLAYGQDPHSGEQLIQHRDTIKTKAGEEVGHRAAWDLTFAPPKSVSQTALVGGDERVREAHHNAVKVALDSTEEYVQARMGGNRPALTTGKWIAATFEHDTSRPVDGYAAPQLHTHVVMFNMTSLDKMRSIDPKEIFRVQSMSTAIYRAELAAALRDLGYELEHRRGHSFEIRGYTQAYLDADSVRRQEILRRMEELGIAGAENAERVSHQTRDKKQLLSADEIRTMHREMAAAFGNQPEKVMEFTRERGPRIGIDATGLNKTAHQAVSFAKNRLIERSAVFDEYELVRDALHHSQGTLRLADVDGALTYRTSQSRGEFVDIQHYRETAPGHRYTTPEMLALERQSIEMVRVGIGAARPIAPDITKETLRERYSHLNAGQENLVFDTLHTRDRIAAVQGGAGTGKTTALVPIREVVEEMGYQTRGLAPTSRAAKELRDAGLQTETLQKHIARSLRPRSEPTVYFLDESSLASTKQLHTFLKSLQSDDRVLLIGDTRQHQAVEAGRVFDQLQHAGMTTFRLDHLVRQKDAGLRNVVEHLSAGKIAEALLLLDEQGRIHEYEHRFDRMAAIAAAYAEAPHSSLVVSPDNTSRRELNDAIRQELRTRGAIGEDLISLSILQPRQGMTTADRTQANSYSPGDVIRYQRESAAIGVNKESYATVLRVDAQLNLLTVELQDRHILTYDPSRAYGVQVYQADSRSFAVGDRIQFTNPWNSEGVANRDTAVITALDRQGNITVQLNEKEQRTLTWNLYGMRHIDHAYAMTSYSAQSITVDRVLIQIDAGDSSTRHLVDQSLAYVAGSRSRHDLELFTDNREQLDKALSRQSIKPTALSQEQSAAYALSQTP